jgi:hypothetical protein
MKNKLLITLTALLAVPSLILADDAQPVIKTKGSAAKVQTAETTFDFGYLHAGGIVSHSYILRSTGVDSLRILKVQPGCGCTKAPLKKDVVAAGDSAEVELVFTSNKAALGSISKTATVTTNDDDRTNFQLVFQGKTFEHADSLLPLTLSIPELSFDGQSRTKEAKVVLTNVSATPVSVQLVSAPSAYLKVDLPKGEIKPGKTQEIKVKIDPSVSEDEFKKSFTFATNDAGGTRYTIPVNYMKVPAMTAQPATTAPASH